MATVHGVAKSRTVGEQLSMQAWESLKVLTLGFLHPSDTMT